MWQSLVMIGQSSSRLNGKKKNKDLNENGKTEWPVAGLVGSHNKYQTI